MKKIIYAILGYIATTAIFNSCNDSKSTILEEPLYLHNHAHRIIADLQNYNDSIGRNSSTSRGIGLAGWLSVALSDASGAYSGAKLGGKIGAIFGPNGASAGAIIGGVVVGAASSYNQYQRAVTIANFAPSQHQLPFIRRQAFAYGSVCYLI